MSGTGPQEPIGGRRRPAVGWGQRVLDAWRRAWFTPADPRTLGACRALLYGILLFVVWDVHVHEWALVSEVFYRPIELFRWTHLPVLPAGALQALEVIWKVSLATSALGIRTRASTWVAFLLGAYLAGIPNNFGKTHHSEAVLVLILGVMAIARPGDALSVDAWRRPGRTPSDGEYRWPIQLTRVLLVCVFVGAGISKLRTSGLDWVLSDNMRLLLIRHHLSHAPPTDLGLGVASHPTLSVAVAAGALAVELGLPLALISARARAVLIPALLAMQVGIWLLMGVLFLPFLAAYPFWLPWDRILPRAGIGGPG